ncbi:hypothetical protein AB0C68_30380 [Streptomyces tendae]|uniref:hypothetical protein n=1 Tax=Streptomyces tendae TaxID=1932 RepID=UPI0033DA3CB5
MGHSDTETVTDTRLYGAVLARASERQVVQRHLFIGRRLPHDHDIAMSGHDN